MNANNILTANLLDILFDGRNKDYGAYELRKTYNRRISISLLITFVTIAILIFSFVIGNDYSSKDVIKIVPPDVVVHSIPDIPPPLPPTPPVLPSSPPPAATIANPPPIIVANRDVVKPPPEIQSILDGTIDVKTLEGSKGIDVINPPVEIKSTQVLAKPDENKTKDSPFIPIEINASFPGGEGAWLKYIQKQIENNIDEFTESDYGTCVVKFIVDTTGKVSQVEASTMKGSKLAEIATNAIRKGPKWIPAQQNGNYVNAYRFQPVTLKNREQ